MKKKTIGEKLRWLRTDRGMTQRQVARGLGISIAGLSKIERNEIDMNMGRLQEFAAFYKINIASLLLEDKPTAAFGNERVQELEGKLMEYEQKVIYLQAKLLAVYENR